MMLAAAVLSLLAYPPHCFHASGRYQDQHDGDMKDVLVTESHPGSTILSITPAPGQNQTWTIMSGQDNGNCSFSVDFDVPGKPNPPPVSLRATVWTLSNPPPLAREAKATTTTNSAIIFTDPSGTLAKPGFPLNTWIKIA